MPSKWIFTRYIAVVVALLLLYLPFFWMLGPVDDSYITCRYAENLAAGQGIVFNPGEKVEGCTAFGMMVLLALFSKLGATNLIVVAQALGILAWAAVCLLTLMLMRKGRAEPFSSMEGFGIAFLVGCLSPLAWAYAAMETPLVAALWIGAVVAHFREDTKGTLPVLSALLTVCAGLMRPDGILIAVVIALSTLLPWGKKRFVRTTIYSTIVLGLFGAYWLWRWNYFGYPLPNTFYAKVGTGSAQLFFFGLFYIGKGLLALGLPIITLIFSHKLVTRKNEIPRRVWVYTGACGISIFYLMYIGGDFFPMQRFFIASLAFWPLLLVELWRLPAKDAAPPAEEIKHATLPQVWIKAIAAVFVINLLCATVQGQLAKHVYLVAITEEWRQAGQYLEGTVPEDTVIAAIPIGALGYESDRYILDMLGLIDTHIAHKQMTTGKGVIGHEKFDTAYVLTKKPDMILTWPMFVRPVGTDLLDWNLNHRLSAAQKTMLLAIRTHGGYEPLAFMMEKDWYVIALVREDLVNTLPYSSWKKIEGQGRQLLFATPKDVQWIFKKLGRKIAKGDLQRAAEKLRRPPVDQPRLF